MTPYEKFSSTALGLIAALSMTSAAVSDELTIATVNNGDMIRMQGLTDEFTEKTGHTSCASASPRTFRPRAAPST